MTPAQLARFEKLYEPVTECGCWLWAGATTGKSKYGQFHLSQERRRQLAHRVSYEHFVGAIPDGLEVDHKCRVRCCVNPDHLQVVTPEQNRLLMAVRRTHCKNGHPLTGITADVRMERTRHDGYARICRICTRANAARFKADPKRHTAMKAYWKRRWIELGLADKRRLRLKAEQASK